MTAYYLSGPMRGKPDYNRKLFAEVEVALAGHLVREGAHIINPAKNFGGRVDLPPSEYMALDLQQVLEADVVVQLPGWRESEGAKREAQLAVWAGKRFLAAERSYYGTDQPDTWDFRETDGPEFSTSPRADLLDEATQLITGDRNAAYGSPIQDFTRSAEALNSYGYRGPEGRRLLPHDIAIMVMAVKISRLMWTPTKRDSWADLAGYAGCGYECAISDE